MRIATYGVMLALVVTTGLMGQERPPFPGRPRLPGGTSTMSGEHPASAVALATWVVRAESDGAHRLKLLVLWRGQPGWWRGPGSGSGGGSGSTIRWTGQHGGVEVRLELDRATRVAQIQGEQVELGDSNVVLVDDVDALEKVTIAALSRVPREVAPSGAGRPDIDSLILSSPEIMSFLRCEVPLPGGAGVVMGSTCAKAVDGRPPPDR